MRFHGSGLQKRRYYYTPFCVIAWQFFNNFVIIFINFLIKDSVMSGLSYKDAGVDIDAGEALVGRIKPFAKATMRPEVIGGLGGFSALCRIPKGYESPLLVSGTDGVGTKLKLAIDTAKHDSIGIDLVAMCANDLLVCGAQPLFFLDYYATGKLNVDTATAVIKGIADGCKQAGCALIGGETAEMPGMYDGNDYDLAGFCVGVVEESRVIDGKRVGVGDVLIGIASSGVHSNGYSLVRKILQKAHDDNVDMDAVQIDGVPLMDALLAPTKIYAHAIKSLQEALIAKDGDDSAIHAMAHITGGGFTENLPRVLPNDTSAVLDVDAIKLSNLFAWLQQMGNVDIMEMYRTFNCGVGFVVVCAPKDADFVIDCLQEAGERAWKIGVIASAQDKRVVYA